MKSLVIINNLNVKCYAMLKMVDILSFRHIEGSLFVTKVDIFLKG